jgi:hypothetical protein
MGVNRRGPSNRFRLVVSLAYVVVAVVVLVWALPDTSLTVPAVLIALSLPLVFRLVPRNWLYGLRTPGTMRGPEEIWYRQNAIAGMVGTAIGIVWLLLAVAR